MIGSIAVSVKAKPSRQACCKEKPKLQVNKFFWRMDSLTVFDLDAIFGSFQVVDFSGVIFRNESATNDLVRKQKFSRALDWNRGNRIGQWSESINIVREMLIWPLVGLVFGGPELFIFAQFCKCHPVPLPCWFVD